MARAKQEQRRDTQFLRSLAERTSRLESLRDGVIQLHFTDGGQAVIRCTRGRAELAEEPVAMEAEPLIEIMGDRTRIQAIVEGKKDARRQFLAGGLRIRGDLRYFSDLAMELAILDEPL